MDETQNLDHSVLEIIRMLSNFETQKQKPLQLYSCRATLSGKDGLPRPRPTAQEHLDLRPSKTILSGREEETQLYIEHRLRVTE
jgi:type II secretory pathway predicted ATPase ExeA